MFSPLVRLVGLFLLAIQTLAAEDPGILFQAGRFQEAAKELRLRLQDLEQIDPQSPDDRFEIAQTNLALGMSLQALGKYEDSLDVLHQVLESYKSLDIEENIWANSWDTLARSQQQAGHLSEAEASFRESLSRREADSSPDAPYWKSITLDHLGLLLLTKGDYQQAGEILTQSLESTPDDDRELLAQRHHYLARYLVTVRNYHRAIEHAEQSVELAQEFEKSDLASYLDLLALARYRSGDQSGAEAALLKALEKLRTQPVNLQRARGEAEILNKVGEFSLQEEASLARSSFQEALDGLLAWLPKDDPSLAVYHNNLGLAAMHMNDHEAASQEFTRALSLLEDHIDGLQLGHQRRAEWKQNLAWNAYMAGDLKATRSAVVDACQEAETALQHLLEKGTERERLNFLANFDLFSLPACAGEAEILDQLLRNNKGLLLSNLISRGTLLAADTKSQNLPENTVMVDFIRYRKPESHKWSFHYGAIIRATGEPPKWIPLAEERLLTRWLEAISKRLQYRALIIGNQSVEPPVIRLEAALRQLFQHFLKPALEQIPKTTKTIILSPDGSLHFVPFASLLDAERNFFASRYPNVLFVSSHRDLNSQQPQKSLSTGRWDLFGISEFASLKSGRDESWFLDELSELPYVKTELAAIRKLAPPGTPLLLNPKNAEELLKAIEPSPAVLHLATHAFFKEPEQDEEFFDLDAHPDIILRSGLALAAPTDFNDGILYPHEIAQLPLEGTQLVSLSACHTGLGTPLAGEGILGLQRAFAIAGAQRILLTLWQVPDESTSRFMPAFYKEALHTENPSFALWHLQGKLLRQNAGALKNDAALEEAVLRHGPFILTHRGPIPSLPTLKEKQPDPPQKIVGRYLLWLFVFGTLIVLLLRYSIRRKKSS
ncbi:MAG: CHAT domain-containing tetratricopeptide repeat protein [Roseibacillus sp.]